MSLITRNLGLFTDFYELTMAQGYFLTNRHEDRACFDYFFRKNPYKGGFTVFAGLGEFLTGLESFRFDDDGLRFLSEEGGMDKRFIEYLKSFRFNGRIYSIREGDLTFPNTPILRVEGNILETQLIETYLLNTINFQSLIATKAARVCQAAKGRMVVDFGLRRSHGDGGIQASRAAAIGGVASTSNVYSALQYGLAPTGTQAHSWVMSYEDEITAFRTFANTFPENCVLLVDTYDTLKSGVPNAITVAREMEAKGQNMKGVRLDSGDLAYLSKRARKMLDQAGLEEVKIVVSNQLDEHLIKSLLDQNAPIDVFGVGTSLVTGQPDAALDGVYKLSECNGQPRIKLSDNVEKVTLPGRKRVIRLSDDSGFYADLVTLVGEEVSDTRAWHPLYPDQFFDPTKYAGDDLLQVVFDAGKRVSPVEPIEKIKAYSAGRVSQLAEEYKRFENPHTYKVSIGEKLKRLRDQMIRDVKKDQIIKT